MAQLSDRGARRAAQEVFDRPVMLEAGAGTGKTTTLVARVLSWCLGTGWERSRDALDADAEPFTIGAETLHGVVAITFTEAAAAEMATRIAESLAVVADGRADTVVGFHIEALLESRSEEELRSRASHLLETFDHLTVGTIHAFCYGLLKNYPLEAGLHPDLRVDAEGRELESAARVAVEQWVQRAYSEGEDTPFLALAAHRVGPSRLMDAVLQWFADGPSVDVLVPDPQSPEQIDNLLSEVRTTVTELLERVGEPLADLPERQVGGKIPVALGETRTAIDLCDSARPEALEELRTTIDGAWPKSHREKLKKWSKDDFAKSEETRLEDREGVVLWSRHLLRDLDAVLGLSPELLEAARKALLPILQQLDGELRARGVITFTGLLRETHSLLKSSPTVLTRERRRIRHLLVDEFQDTDPIQAEIVRELALEGPGEERPSLFVVGDPKQSIYAWRDADLRSYEGFQKALEEAGGESHTLDVNFRSVPQILDEVERVVEPIMRQEAGVQPAFHGLEPSSKVKQAEATRSDPWRPVEYWVSWARKPDTDLLAPCSQPQATEVEARQVAADIRDLHERGGVPYQEIAILFRSARTQPFYLDELRRLGVPYSVTRDRHYYQRREVIEAAAWVRAVLNPTDHLALLTILRSVTVGVPDAALIPLWQRSFPKLVTDLAGPDDPGLKQISEIVSSAAESMPPDLPGLNRIGPWQESLLSAMDSLARLRRSYRRDPGDVFVRTMRRELLVEASEAARFQGKFRLANLGRFFRQLEAALESDEADVHSILRALRLGVMESREAEEAKPQDAVEAAVQVMTVHTAKGLEFDHVYLVQLHAGTRGPGESILDTTEVSPGDWEYQLFGAQTPGFERAKELNVQVEAAEAVRILYVAMTRAAQRLVLVGSWPANLRPVEPDRAQNYIDLLQSRDELPASVSEPANDPQIALLGHWDHGGIRWRFLGGETLTGSHWPEPEAASWLPKADQVADLAEDHRTRSLAARDRMTRPWVQAVTAGTADRLEAAAATFETDESQESLLQIDASRDTAMELGTIVHRCLETWRLDRPVGEELERQRERLHADLRLRGRKELIEATEERLEQLATSTLLERLRSLGGSIIGREVPLLSPTSGEPESPVGCISGAIDLLYRDPDTGETVVVDFKTDRIEEDQLAGRAEAYRPQETAYAAAVQAMLGLDRPPRTELWFLWPDRVWTHPEINT